MKISIFQKIYLSLIITIIITIISVTLISIEAQAAGGSVAPAELSNPLGKNEVNIPLIIGGVINVALGFVGSIALAIFIWGGFVWMTAAGNSNQVAKGKEILVWATVGLVVIFTSYAIVRFLFEALGVG